MASEKVGCLLDELYHLNVSSCVSERHNPFETRGWLFGSGKPTNASVVQEVDWRKFINRITNDQRLEIDELKSKILIVMAEIKSMQAQALLEQKKVAKILYDIFAKYEGVEQASDWMRATWFGLHGTGWDRDYGKWYNKNEHHRYIPENWIAKMRFGRLSTYGLYDNSPEMVATLAAYAQQKQAWEQYVDEQWDSAYEEAFEVKEFQNFLEGIPRRISLDLNSVTADDITNAWTDLFHQTRYFEVRICMNHTTRNITKFEWDKIPDNDKKDFSLAHPSIQRQCPVLLNFVEKLALLRTHAESLKNLTRTESYPPENPPEGVVYTHRLG